jgi:hypothetical protein
VLSCVLPFQRVDRVERRHELSQSLNAIAPEVVAMMFKVITDCVAKEPQLGTLAYKSPYENSERRVKVGLSALLAYIEWVNPSWFVSEGRIPILFAFMKRPSFKLEAISCICQVHNTCYL